MVCWLAALLPFLPVGWLIVFQVESFQANGEGKQVDIEMADLQAQMDDVRRANLDINEQLFFSRRELCEQEKKNVELSRDVEWLQLHLVDFKKLESNEYHLEVKLDEFCSMERENRDMQLNLSCLDSPQVEKAELQAMVSWNADIHFCHHIW